MKVILQKGLSTGKERAPQQLDPRLEGRQQITHCTVPLCKMFMTGKLTETGLAVLEGKRAVLLRGCLLG